MRLPRKTSALSVASLAILAGCTSSEAGGASSSASSTPARIERPSATPSARVASEPPRPPEKPEVCRQYEAACQKCASKLTKAQKQACDRAPTMWTETAAEQAAPGAATDLRTTMLSVVGDFCKVGLDDLASRGDCK